MQEIVEVDEIGCNLRILETFFLDLCSRLFSGIVLFVKATVRKTSVCWNIGLNFGVIAVNLGLDGANFHEIHGLFGILML